MEGQETLGPSQESIPYPRRPRKWLLLTAVVVSAAAAGFYSAHVIWPPGDIQEDGRVVRGSADPAHGPTEDVDVGGDKRDVGWDKRSAGPPQLGLTTSPQTGLTHGGPALRLSHPTAAARQGQENGAERAPSATDSMAGIPDPASPVPAAPEALFEEATRLADCLVQAFPAKPDALEVKARLLEWLGKSKEAVVCWERALQLDPNYAYAHLGLGTVAAVNQDYRKAAELLRKAVELNPGYFSARIALADALLGLGQPKEVIAILEDYLRRDPRSEGFFLLGQAYVQVQQYEKARESFEAAVRKYPEFGEAYYRLSTVCARLGQQDKARQHLQKSRALLAEQREDGRVKKRRYDDLNAVRRRLSDTRRTAARTYSPDGDPPPAERLWRRAADLAPKDVECRQGLAWLCRQEGRIPETIAILEQLAAIEPNNPGYRPEIDRLRTGLSK